jgi:hypothetical protein
LEIADKLFAQAKVLRDAGDLARAEKASREALAIYVTIFSIDGYWVVECRAFLNEVLKLEGKPAE